MNVYYDILFTVYYKHNYFISNKLQTFETCPTSRSAIDILRNGLLFKPFSYGFHILYETGLGNTKRTREQVLKEHVNLVFAIDNKDAFFYNYTTNFLGDTSKNIFVFKNKEGNFLHEKDVVSNSDIISVDTDEEEFCGMDIRQDNAIGYRNRHEFFQYKKFGFICIQLHEKLSTSLQIQFGAKATYWRYIIVSDYLQEFAELAIVHEHTTFSIATNITLPDDRKAKVLTSNIEVQCAEKIDKGYQLIEYNDKERKRYKVIIPVLPNPTIGRISSVYTKEEVAKTEKKEFSEIFI